LEISMNTTTISTNAATSNAADLAGRALLASLFLVTGFSKMTGYAATQAYMVATGVPGSLLPLVIALELGGGLALVLGYRTRLVAAALALFTIAAGVLFHSGADPMQRIMFLKNIALAGAFLLLVARGAGGWSLDAWRSRPTVVAGALATGQA
jgi:putative oxidoreductase